ncbi:MAG: 16S rRNA (cytosine(967)-C(5))-methyltransferase RsmB [Verrucomicrobiales bacterium]
MPGKFSRDPRALALKTLVEWEESGQFLDELLEKRGTPLGVSTPDRGFFQELVYGCVRWKLELDFLCSQFLKKEPEPFVRQLLRLGTYQIWHLRVPDHAAVHTTVALADRAKPLVNAILRRLLANRDAVEAALEKQPLHVRLSHPETLVSHWNKQWGEAITTQFLEWNNSPPPLFARANTLRTSRLALLQQTEFQLNPHPEYRELLQFQRLNPQARTWLEQGLIYVQDASTLFAPLWLDPKPGETILDACAAPGGKTMMLAALAQNQARIIASDSQSPRLQEVLSNAQRMGATGVETVCHDWARHHAAEAEHRFDAVLVDTPCSNTGVLRRRVDARWRLELESPRTMSRVQLKILHNAWQALKPGGRLVYSTCSIEPQENQEVVENFLQEQPTARLSRALAIYPWKDRMDGAYVALLQKKSKS